MSVSLVELTQGNHARLIVGRGQPLSFTLSFGEIPWFDEEGEIRR